MKKRILSLATAIALVGSTLIAPITANAAATITTLVDEQFADSTLSGGIVATVNNNITFNENPIVMDNSFAVDETAGKLKLVLKGSNDYAEDHAFRTASTSNPDNRTSIAQLAKVSLKIPIPAVTADSKVNIGFKLSANALNDLNCHIIWNDFASIYDNDGKALVLCKRNQNADNGYIGSYPDDKSISNASFGRLDNLIWLGKVETEKGKAIDLTSLTLGKEQTGGGGTWNITSTDNNVSIAIDNATKKVDIGYDRESGRQTGTVYAGDADLTKGGYIFFEGYLNTWMTQGNNSKNKTATVTFDDILITAEQDLVPKKMPIHNEMNVADTYGTELQSKVTAGRYTIIDEPGVEGNKVLAVNMEDYPTSATASNNTNMMGAVWFPYEGLGADDNLKVSYRFKDPNKNHNLYWQHFGTITNDTTDAWNAAAGTVKDVLRCARYDYEAGMFHESQEWVTNLTYYGMTEATKLGEQIVVNGPAQQMVTHYIKNVSDWVRVDINIERASKKATITYTNEATNTVLATGDTYLINDLASSGALYFKGGPSVNNKSAAQTIYIDDVKISTWKALTVDSTNLNDSFDAATPITLTFSDTLPDETKVKQAISIKETVSGAEVAPARISVALDGTKKIATVTVADGLKYGKTGYTLKLNGGVIKSAADVPLTADYTKPFTTKMGPSVFVASNTALSGDATKTTTISIDNPTGGTKAVWAVLALYSSNNELVGLGQYANAALATGVTSGINLTATVETGKTVSKAQILLWDSTTSLIPYHIPVPVQ